MIKGDRQKGSRVSLFEDARWDLIFHVGNKESPDGIPSCLRSLEGISCFAIWRSPDGTSYFMLVIRNRRMGFQVV